MASITPTEQQKPNARRKFQWHHYIPILSWGRRYKRADLSGDLMAGVIVAIMLVPQGMAYALLAGLPPQFGLYASILPLLIYGILGTSRALAVGPVALVSIMVAAAVSGLAEQGSVEYIQLALTLALLVGLIKAGMGLLRLGFLVNFLSYPVLAGFTSAAAIVIGFSQLKHVLGLAMPRLGFLETVQFTAVHINETNLLTFAIGLGAIIILLLFKYGLGKLLKRWGWPDHISMPITKSAPLIVVFLGTMFVFMFHFDQTAGIKVVGDVPSGLPRLTLPIFDLDTWRALLPTALVISFVGYMQSISVAKSLASKKREKVDANQELLALGVADLGAAFTGGFPVTGGLSRSIVNFSAGANTGLASIITAVLMAFTVLFLTPLFYFLPKAALAAIILVAVIGLIDVKTFVHVWHYNKGDAVSMIITFFAVLGLGIETGILVGMAAAMLLYIYRTSQPHVAVVGRLGESEHYRNVLRHDAQTCPHAIAIRVDESLYFPNTKYIEDTVLSTVADHQEIDHFVLIGIAVNYIDASALETLNSLHYELKDAGVTFHLAGIKGPVMDRLKKVGFVEKFGAENIHLNTHEAMKAIGCTQGTALDLESG